MEEFEEKKRKDIKIITGDSKDLNISKVRDNLTFEVQEDTSSKNNIVIPQNQKHEDQ